jgi:hypothetical protein
MLLGCALALSVLIGPATAAQAAATHTTVVGTPTLQAAVGDFLVAQPPGRVRVLLAPCPGAPAVQGCHSAGRRMDTIWLNDAAGGNDSETLAHEMGHVFESYMWDLYWRSGPRHSGARFVPRMFHRMAPLLYLSRKPGVVYSTAWSERFAEAYSLCTRIGQLPAPVSTYYWGFRATPATHARTCALIDAMSRHYKKGSRVRKQ